MPERTEYTHRGIKFTVHLWQVDLGEWRATVVMVGADTPVAIAHDFGVDFRTSAAALAAAEAYGRVEANKLADQRV